MWLWLQDIYTLISGVDSPHADASHKIPASKIEEKNKSGSPCRSKYYATGDIWPVKELKYIPWHDGDLLHTLIVFWHSPGNASQLLQVSFPCGKITSSSKNVKETESKRKSSSW